MKRLRLLIIILSLLILSTSGYADTLSGTVVEIVGQRVTILNDKGEEITLTFIGAGSLQIGDKVQIEFYQVADVLIATDVQRIQ